MQEIIVQSVPRVKRVTERHRWETTKEVLRPRWLAKTRIVSFWGCLSLSTILCLGVKVQKVREYWRIKHWRRQHWVKNSRFALNMGLEDKRQNVSSTGLCDFSFIRKEQWLKIIKSHWDFSSQHYLESTYPLQIVTTENGNVLSSFFPSYQISRDFFTTSVAFLSQWSRT